jgi:integrase
MDYPFPHIVRMLILTGGRLREISDLAWSEIDLDKLLISIPAGRMKGSRDHDIPIAPMALTLLRSLPRFTRGDYAFTCTSGVTAFQGFRKPKLRLDSLSGVTGWVLHDLRRSMRSNLSARAIEDRVREAMIAHAQPGLHAVYDKWKYVDEKRRGFTLWEQRLAGIINPTPATVADIGAARKRMSMPGQVSDLNRARTPRQAAE